VLPISLPRRRLRLGRRLRFWPSSLIAALVAGVVTAAVVADARSAARSSGERHRVPVAARELAVGHPIEAGDVEWAELPRAATRGATGDDPVGRVVRERILDSEPIAAERLAPAGASGAGALVPDGHRAVAVPVGPLRPPLDPGDLVDVLTAPAFGAGRADAVARGALVIARDEEVVTVAVAESELARTARAVLDGSALLALVGP
jgi:Flp pilus assembly protein CpaB